MSWTVVARWMVQEYFQTVNVAMDIHLIKFEKYARLKIVVYARKEQQVSFYRF